MEGLSDSLVTRAGKARLATPELVGQEGDLLTRSRPGGVMEEPDSQFKFTGGG
jgi:hypothetical protein